jgi:hypothetical protein
VERKEAMLMIVSLLAASIYQAHGIKQLLSSNYAAVGESEQQRQTTYQLKLSSLSLEYKLDFGFFCSRVPMANLCAFCQGASVRWMAIVNFCPILSYNRITFFIGGRQVLWTVFPPEQLALACSFSYDCNLLAGNKV